MNKPNSPETSNYIISQDIELLKPVPRKGYAISCKEWDLLKSIIKSIKDDVNWYLTFGSGFFGTALATLISIFTVIDWYDTSDKLTTKIIICWAVFAVTIIISVVLFISAHQHKEITHGKSRDALALMKIIEDRFPNIEESTIEESTETSKPNLSSDDLEQLRAYIKKIKRNIK